MFHLFRSRDREPEDEELLEAARRNEAAHDDLRHALRRLLAERNVAGTPKEHAH